MEARVQRPPDLTLFFFGGGGRASPRGIAAAVVV